MKKLWILMLVFAMVFALTACSGGDEPAAVEEPAESGDVLLELPVVISNETGVDIYGLYATSANLENWGDDILGGNYLPAGESIESTFYIGEGDVQWDMKMVDSEGTEISLMGLDFTNCSTEGGTIVLEFDGEAGYATLYSE